MFVLRRQQKQQQQRYGRCTLLVVLVSTFVVTLVSGGASSIRPEISIGLNADSITSSGPLLGASLEPVVKWTTSGTIRNNIGYEGGITVRGNDNGSLPYAVWGKLKKQFGKWNVATKVDTTSNKLELLTVEGTVSGKSTQFQIKGQYDVQKQTGKVSTIQAVQKLDAPTGSLKIHPKYNVQTQQADVSVSYGIRDTVVIVDANVEEQKITLQQHFGDNNVVAPSITNTGDIEVEYSRAIGETGTGSIQFHPTNGLVFQYEDPSWVATLVTPFKKTKNNGGPPTIDTDSIQLRIRRSVV